LALSSRNRYLADDERQRALALSRALSLAERAIRDGQSSGAAVMAVLRDTLIAGGVTKIDYAVVADPRTLKLVAHIAGPVVLLIAAWVGSTRLIDNRLVD
jgi:pantoate--beta-alanine ligase